MRVYVLIVSCLFGLADPAATGQALSADEWLEVGHELEMSLLSPVAGYDSVTVAARPLVPGLDVLTVPPPVAVAGAATRCEQLCYLHFETPANHNGLWNLDVGDLDGDRDMDVVAVGMSGDFSVFKNRGDASFEQPIVHTVGHDPRCIRLADVDGDLDLDLVVANSLGGVLFIYTNPGNGVFGPPSAEYVFPPEQRPLDFVIRDLDADGDPDIAVSDPYGDVATLWNAGDGIFKFGRSYKINAYGFLYEILAENLDEDAHPDLAVLVVPYKPYNVEHYNAKVVTLTNDGWGGFDEMRSFRIPEWPTVALASADLDGDGDLDLAGVHRPNGRLPGRMWVMFNDGGGSFGKPRAYPVGLLPYDVSFADLDGDGDQDAVVANQHWDDPPPHEVSILLNRGDGTFEDQCPVIVGTRPIAALPAYLDANDTLDIVVANARYPSTISVLRDCGR